MTEIILTHDHADFDAVAAQVAASKLWPEAYVVKSPRLRRTVRHFLTLYGAHLPFVDRKDVPKEKVTRALIVDTQKWQSIRGMSDATHIELIDHHALQKEMQDAWTVQIEPVGAATTLVVERIQGVAVSPVEATLIMLGIYADTGSLTYGLTTPRDILAAAWALEQGAMLDVVRDFLNQPLSESQLDLYENLLDNIEVLDFGGTSVALAAVEAKAFRGDIAAIAHQLRDLMDTAALFLLIDLGRHIQLVARGMDDVVDVGAVAQLFGGGGHARASAARIRDAELADTREELLKVLGKRVRRGARVGDLMSTRVHTLTPSDRVDEAFRRMATYGHEGYPVVDEEEKVVGLATRRAVDRAMNHGLEGVRISEVMEAGAIGVQAKDALSAVRRVMVDYGWGQVPVIDADGRLQGIITRTDLIKHDVEQPVEPVFAQLRDAVPPELLSLLREMGRIAVEQGVGLYVVGGFVRDVLLGRPTVDIDLVVEGHAPDLAHAMAEQIGGHVVVHEKFRTANWYPSWEVLDITPDQRPEQIDFATARREFYEEPTSLPTVERSGIKLDLHRRDFTINTLALRLDPAGFGRLLDFYGGLRDLREGRIRVLHSMSFVDDPTRMLRAVRYEQRFGFEMETRTERMIGRWLEMLDRVSGDRIRHEFERLLTEPEPEKGLARLSELGLLRGIHPAFKTDQSTLAGVRDLRYALDAPPWTLEPAFNMELALYTVILGRMRDAVITQVGDRLKVRRQTTSAVMQASAAWHQLYRMPPDAKPSHIDAALDGLQDAEAMGVWALLDGVRRAWVAKWARTWRHMYPVTDGHMLIERGLEPGPRFGEILQRLRQAYLDGEITTKAQEMDLLAELLA